MASRQLLALTAVLILGFAPAAAFAACSNPSKPEAFMFYNQDYHMLQFCNGTDWIAVGSSGGTSSGTTFDAGSGFFVLSKTAYTGNLGGVSGADAKCLTDLTTYDWSGKTFAQSAGLLDSTHVKSWLCDHTTCNNATANAKYYFSVAGNPKVGGASFTATAAGKGPGDSSSWIDDDHFGGPYIYWTNRNNNSNTLWNTTPYIIDTANNVCNDWASTSPSGCSKRGYANATNRNRFDNDSQCEACSESYNLVCLVNP